jgi:succinate dehydrogenase / fumarate reductase membrane anchor subunit
MSKFTSKSELSKAKNHGAGEGTHHWIVSRITSFALIPLTIWFVYSVLTLVGKGAATAANFFESPINASLMAILIFFSFYHTILGLQVVIEDYVHCHFKKIASLLIVKIGLFALGTACVLAIIKLHLG